MPEPIRFVRPIEVEFGGQLLMVGPIKGMARFREFQQAVVEEVARLAAAADRRLQGRVKPSAEALLIDEVDAARLLKLGCPEITDELLEESTQPERLGLAGVLCTLNNLGRFAPFLAPDLIAEVAIRLGMAKKPEFPTAELSPSSSLPASAGATSSAS